MGKLKETFFPDEENLSKDCMYWGSQITAQASTIGCVYPKFEIQGRTSCEGIVDEVCLFIKDRRNTDKISPQDKLRLKTQVPQERKHYIPPDRE